LIRLGNTYTVGNFKGGVGKSKIVEMLAYDNSEIRKRNTCVIDLDPQANATTAIGKSFDIDKIDKTITDGVANRDLKTCITKVTENLDLIAGSTDFISFPTLINSIEDEQEQAKFLDKLIDPIRKDYDEIFIDVPPTISVYSDNAMAASDFSIIAFQTIEESYEGVEKYVKYQEFMIKRYDIDLQIIDIIPCMTESNDELDIELLQNAREKYGSVVSDNIIYYQKRLKRYSSKGITLKRFANGNYDQWDYKAHSVFLDILAELDARREFLAAN
jgi:chromosome partitioning protein